MNGGERMGEKETHHALREFESVMRFGKERLLQRTSLSIFDHLLAR